MDFHPATVGGVQTAVTSLARGLRAAGHEVTVFCLPGDGPHDPDVVALGTLRGVDVNGFRVVRPGAANDRLVDGAFAARGPIDLVHTHTTYGAAITGMRAARRHRIPLIHTAHSRDDVFIQQNSPAPYAAALALRALHGRFVPHRFTMPAGDGSRAARHAWWTMAGQAQTASQVIAPTAHFAALLRAHGVTKPIQVASNGVDDALIDAPADMPDPVGGRLRLVWCGRLAPEKRPLEAIAAVAQSPECELDVYGEGPLAAQADAAISDGALRGRVRLHGAVPHEVCLAAMKRADALLCTSIGADTQGMTVLEAVAVGLPVVFCDPALAESVPAGAGARSADESVSALAATISGLADDRDRLALMSAALAPHRDSVRQSRTVANILDVYARALNPQLPELTLPQSLSSVPTAPGALPLVGHSLRALRDAPGFVTSLQDSGPIVRVYFGRKTGYLLTTPELVREVGLGMAGEFNRDDLREAISDVAGGSVNVLRGDEHKLRRRMIAPALRQQRMNEYAIAAADIANKWAAGLPAGERVNLMDEAHGLILDTVSSTLFTASFSDGARSEIRDTIPWLLSQVIVRTALPPQLRQLRLVANYKFRTKSRRLRTAIGAVIAEYRRRDEDFQDVVSALIRHTDAETGARLSDEHIIDEAILMLAGGVGSMASLAGWLWHEVMARPAIAGTLWAELDSVLDGEPVHPRHVGQLPYLRQVVAETLRFWGPWVSASNASGDVTIGGLTIPDGTAIMFSPYMVQHDKRYYPNPEAFDPDRWAPDNADSIDKKANLTFGVGKRRCLGDHFAMLEITLASAALLARWRPVPDPRYRVRASNRDFVLSPSAIPVTLTPR